MLPSNQSVKLTIALVVAVLLAGCAGAIVGEEEPDDVDTDELQAESLDAMDEVDSFTFEMTQTFEMMGESMESTSEGAIDADAGELWIETVTEEEAMTVTSEQYVVEDTMYLRMGDEWVKAEMGEEYDFDAADTSQHHEALDIGNLTLEETTTFDGHEVYVVNVEMDGADMAELFEEMDGGFDHGMGVDEDVDEDFGDAFDEDIFEEFDEDAIDIEMTQYVDAESFYVRYVEMDMKMTLLGMETSMTMEVTYDNFDDPVDIELPDAAEDATHIDDWEGDMWGEDW